MRLFCKHEYVMKIAEKVGDISYKDIDGQLTASTNMKVGCIVYCKKCGKQKKILSKKLGKIYGNTITEELSKKVINDIITKNILPEEFCNKGE